MGAEVMRCVECQHFHRLDLRTSPARVVCDKSVLVGDEVDVDHGCGMGKPKPKGSTVWKQGGGSSWNKA